MKLRPEERTSVLKSRIKQYDAGVDIQEVGTVVEVGDGVARIQGLEKAVASEMLELPHGVTGLVLNLASMKEMGYVGRIEQLQGRESDWHKLGELTPTGDGPLVPPMVTLHIQGGRKEKIRPGDVLGALTADLGYTREQVGKINVNEWSTYVAVDRAIAAQAASRLNAGRIKGKSVKVRVLEE